MTRMMWFNTSFLVQMHRCAWGTKKGSEAVLAIHISRSFFQECLAQAVCSTTSGVGGCPGPSSPLLTKVGIPSGGIDVGRKTPSPKLTRQHRGEEVQRRGGNISTPSIRPRTLLSSRGSSDVVRLHWEPDRLPSGEKHRRRRAVQLGFKGEWLHRIASGVEVVHVERLDALLAWQRRVLSSPTPQDLSVPLARVFDPDHLDDAQLEALHMVSERARPKLRILCLHGSYQDSKTLARRMRQLSKRLRATAEVIYVDAPHLSGPPPPPPPGTMPVASMEDVAVTADLTEGEQVGVGQSGSESQGGSQLTLIPTLLQDSEGSTAMDNRVQDATPSDLAIPSPPPALSSSPQPPVNGLAWWRCDPEEKRVAKAVPGLAGRCRWGGLERSLELLVKLWDEQGPFDGLMGFSQGAAMASVFYHCAFEMPSRQEEHIVSAPGHASQYLPRTTYRMAPRPKFGIFVSGCYQPHPAQVPSYPPPPERGQYPLPSFHIWAVDDPFVPMAESQHLAGLYARPGVLMHHGSHCIPQKKDTVPHFVRFLERFR
ncbi:unnamed protein product [Discosporangium mesarthrocarpum]